MSSSKLPHADETIQDRIQRESRHFWRRLTEGLQLQQLWSQFKSETRESYGLYSQEIDWDAIDGMKRWKRPIELSRILFWSMLGKLSPARRLYLLAALLLVIFSITNNRLFGMSQEVQFLLAAAALVVLLALELADRVTMKRDLEIAREIQSWLLPSKPPQVPGIDMAFATRPANTVGGDYYDVFKRGGQDESDGSLLLTVADVAGKSVPAALLMATFQARLRTLAAVPSTFEEFIGSLNRSTSTQSLGGRRFITAFLAELDPIQRTLTFACAGHNAPILRRSSGAIERLDSGGLPLGIDPHGTYRVQRLTLEHGDMLLIFTDGLLDAVNDEGQEFGEERVLAQMRSLRALHASESVKALMASVDRFVGSVRQFDDITCFVIHVT